MPPQITTAQQLLKTLLTSCAVHWAHHVYKNNPLEEQLEQIMQANERLAAQHLIDEHINKGLSQAL